jgi:hypothetical protein
VRRKSVADRIDDFIAELQGYDDRCAACLGTGILESALSSAIKKRLVDCRGDGRGLVLSKMGACQSLPEKIEFGFLLGLYNSTMRAVLEIVREVNDRFLTNPEIAHLEHPKIVQLLRKCPDRHYPRNLSARQLFTTLLAESLSLFYLEEESDIRLVSLWDAHPRLFAKANSIAVEKVGAEVSKKKLSHVGEAL